MIRDLVHVYRTAAHELHVICRRPPRGWRCKLGAGHRGPCAPHTAWWNVSGRFWGRTRALR